MSNSLSQIFTQLKNNKGPNSYIKPQDLNTFIKIEDNGTIYTKSAKENYTNYAPFNGFQFLANNYIEFNRLNSLQNGNQIHLEGLLIYAENIDHYCSNLMSAMNKGAKLNITIIYFAGQDPLATYIFSQCTINDYYYESGLGFIVHLKPIQAELKINNKSSIIETSLFTESINNLNISENFMNNLMKS